MEPKTYIVYVCYPGTFTEIAYRKTVAHTPQIAVEYVQAEGLSGDFWVYEMNDVPVLKPDWVK